MGTRNVQRTSGTSCAAHITLFGGEDDNRMSITDMSGFGPLTWRLGACHQIRVESHDIDYVVIVSKKRFLLLIECRGSLRWCGYHQRGGDSLLLVKMSRDR